MSYWAKPLFFTFMLKFITKIKIKTFFMQTGFEEMQKEDNVA